VGVNQRELRSRLSFFMHEIKTGLAAVLFLYIPPWSIRLNLYWQYQNKRYGGKENGMVTENTARGFCE
jgi:hypothetical protein